MELVLTVVFPFEMSMTKPRATDGRTREFATSDLVPSSKSLEG
jgi:hypothetical protein